jgi:hypothetical protein
MAVLKTIAHVPQGVRFRQGSPHLSTRQILISGKIEF